MLPESDSRMSVSQDLEPSSHVFSPLDNVVPAPSVIAPQKQADNVLDSEPPAMAEAPPSDSEQA